MKGKSRPCTYTMLAAVGPVTVWILTVSKFSPGGEAAAVNSTVALAETQLHTSMSWANCCCSLAVRVSQSCNKCCCPHSSSSCSLLAAAILVADKVSCLRRTRLAMPRPLLRTARWSCDLADTVDLAKSIKCGGGDAHESSTLYMRLPLWKLLCTGHSTVGMCLYLRHHHWRMLLCWQRVHVRTNGTCRAPQAFSILLFDTPAFAAALWLR